MFSIVELVLSFQAEGQNTMSSDQKQELLNVISNLEVDNRFVQIQSAVILAIFESNMSMDLWISC